MKRNLIGALVGAILVFGWQSTAHMFLPYHDAAFKVAPNQESLITTLSGAFTEEGQYLVPRSNPAASQEEMQKYNESMKGKPWALITYHPTYESEMGMSIIRSFTTALLSVLIFIWLLGKNPGSYGNIFFKGLALGFVMFIYVHYNQNIWMQTPWSVIKGELIDLLAAWGLCGLWLGWWLNRKQAKSY